MAAGGDAKARLSATGRSTPLRTRSAGIRRDQETTNKASLADIIVLAERGRGIEQAAAAAGVSSISVPLHRAGWMRQRSDRHRDVLAA